MDISPKCFNNNCYFPCPVSFGLRSNVKRVGTTISPTLKRPGKSNVYINKKIESCNKNFKMWMGKCYSISQDKRTWQESSDACGSFGGKLTSILSATEHRFLTNWYEQTHGSRYTGFWTGGYRYDPNTWRWTDGSEFSYFKWKKNNPDSRNFKNRLVSITGKFENVGVNYGKYYICKVLTRKSKFPIFQFSYIVNP